MNREEVAKKLCDLGLVLLSCKYDGFVECHLNCKQYKEMLKIADWILENDKEAFAQGVKYGRKDTLEKIGMHVSAEIDTITVQEILEYVTKEHEELK